MVGHRVLRRGQPSGQGAACDPPHRAPSPHIGGGSSQLVHRPLPCEQVHLEQVHCGAPPLLLSPKGQGRIQCGQGVARLHPRHQELLQQADSQGALPARPGPAPHAVAQQHIEGAVLPLEVGPGVPAHRLPVLLPGCHARHRHQRLQLDQSQALLPRLRSGRHTQQIR